MERKFALSIGTARRRPAFPHDAPALGDLPLTRLTPDQHYFFEPFRAAFRRSVRNKQRL